MAGLNERKPCDTQPMILTTAQTQPVLDGSWHKKNRRKLALSPASLDLVRLHTNSVWLRWLPAALWDPGRSQIRPHLLPATSGNHLRRSPSSARIHLVRLPDR